MFSPVVLSYRAGVRITFAGKHYYFTRKYFMQKFASFIKLRNSRCERRLSQLKDSHHLKSFDDFYLASLSIYDQGCDGAFAESAADDYLWKFDIAGRRVECDHNSDRYMRDLDLSREYPNQFKDRGASYLEMAKFIDGDDVSISGVEIARQMMDVFLGQQERVDECPLIPSILSAWFIAEASRSPVVFLPSLLLLDLILRQAPCSTMGVYTMTNSLTNPHLLPKARACVDPVECILMRSMGLFNRYDLDRQERAEASSALVDTKVYIKDEDRAFYNVGGQNNGSSESVDRSKIKPSDALVRSAGWQAMSARFSFSELSVTDPKQQALDAEYAQGQDGDYALKEEPISNVKSFSTMVDWLWSRGVAMPLHVNTIQTLSGQVNFDEESEVHILDQVFSTLMEKVVEILNTDGVLVFTDGGLMDQNDANYSVFVERACEEIFPEFTEDCNDEDDLSMTDQEDDLSSDEYSEYDEKDECGDDGVNDARTTIFQGARACDKIANHVVINQTNGSDVRSTDSQVSCMFEQTDHGNDVSTSQALSTTDEKHFEEKCSQSVEDRINASSVPRYGLFHAPEVQDTADDVSKLRDVRRRDELIVCY